MEFDETDVFYKKEFSTVDKFKIKSTILKDYGPNALRIFNSIDGTKTLAEIRNLLDIPQEEFYKFVDTLYKLGFIYLPGQENFSTEPKEKSSDVQESQQSIAKESKEKQPSSMQSLQPTDSSRESLKPSSSPQPPETGTEEDYLTVAEKEIFKKYGDIGLKVYSMVDGYKSAQEIMDEIGINETLFIEILEFMQQKGFITLESKEKTPDSGNKKIESEQAKKHGILPSGISPMHDKDSTPPVVTDQNLKLIFVPSLKKLSPFDYAKLKFILSIKFKLDADNFISLLDGSNDLIDLFLQTEMPLKNIEDILDALKKENFINLEPLTRIQIEKKYGSIGLAAYKKYGLYGTLIYSLIGKSSSLLEMVKKTKIEPKKAADILLFLSNILGLDLKVDKETILSVLSSSSN